MKEKTPAEQVQDALTLIGRLFVREQDARKEAEEALAFEQRSNAKVKQPRFMVGDTVFVRPPLDPGVQKVEVLYVQIKQFADYDEVAYGFRSIGAFAAGRVFATAEEAFGG